MTELNKAEADRREFLKTAGKFAVVVPPAMTFLLSTTMASSAVAASSACNSGNGNGDEFLGGTECDPGNSGENNSGMDGGSTGMM